MTDSTLFPFTALGLDRLAQRFWPLPGDDEPRGVVILVHGLGEHVGRYEHVAARLTQWGFAVRGYDQFGHGLSDGPRGALPTEERLIEDLADVVDDARMGMPDHMPLILLGHSLGGLVAARFVARAVRPVQGLVLSSPALDPGLRSVHRALLRLLYALAPNLRLRNGLNPRGLSHDAAVVQAYRADPLVHDRISMRLAHFITEAAPATLALAARWSVPTLLLYAGTDKLVDPAGSRAFAAAAPPEVVAAQCFEPLYHEIFNEAQPEPVFAALQAWLQSRFAAPPQG